MKTIKLTEEAWKKITMKKYQWGSKTLSDFLLSLCESQEELQRCYWSLIKGETTIEKERELLHYDQSKK